MKSLGAMCACGLHRGRRTPVCGLAGPWQAWTGPHLGRVAKARRTAFRMEDVAMRVMIAVLALTAGCATAPADGERPLANGVEVARSVVLCQTTVADLETRLGVPSRDGVLGRARLVTWIVAWDPLVKYLGVMADERGTVVDLYWNLPSEVQWLPVNRCK